MFQTVPLSIIRSYSLYTQQWCMSYRFVDSLQAGSGWNSVPSWSCSQAVSKPVWHTPLLCVQWITPDDGQRNCPKHVEFHSKNKCEKSVHLVGFIIKNLLYFIHISIYKIKSPLQAFDTMRSHRGNSDLHAVCVGRKSVSSTKAIKILLQGYKWAYCNG
jgi:hypothetical protein